MDGAVPTLGFDSDELPAGTAFATWAQLTPGYEASLPEAAAPADFRMRSNAWLLGSLTVAAGTLSPMCLARRPANIAADRRDNYNFLLLTSGRWQSAIGPTGLEVASGEICIVDFATTWSVETTQNDHVMIIVPRRAIAERCPSAPSLHGRKLDGTAGRLLADHFVSLAKYLPSMSVRDVPLVEEATLHLLAGAVNTLEAIDDRGDEPGGGSSVASRVGDFIDRNISAPTLSVAEISRSLGITRSTLYRSFEAIGGIAGHIQRQRLDAAHGALADRAETRSVAAISQLFCFSSPAYFSTAFRRAYGYSPQDVRRHLGRDGMPAVASEFRHWMQWLAREVA